MHSSPKSSNIKKKEKSIRKKKRSTHCVYMESGSTFPPFGAQNALEPAATWPCSLPYYRAGSQISFWMSINKVFHPLAIRRKHFSGQRAYAETRQIRDVSLSPIAMCNKNNVFTASTSLLSNSPHLPPTTPTRPRFYVEILPRKRKAEHSKILSTEEI